VYKTDLTALSQKQGRVRTKKEGSNNILNTMGFIIWYMCDYQGHVTGFVALIFLSTSLIYSLYIIKNITYKIFMYKIYTFLVFIYKIYLVVVCMHYFIFIIHYYDSDLSLFLKTNKNSKKSQTLPFLMNK
jgi:hypothetical protein